MSTPLIDYTPKRVRDKLREMELLIRDAKRSARCGDHKNAMIQLEEAKLYLSASIIIYRVESEVKKK